MSIVKRAWPLLFLYSCAGPTTPFGSSVWVKPEFKSRMPATGSGAHIAASPERQQYHSPFDLTLKIEDNQAIPKNFRFEILYNGKKVDRWYRGEKIVFERSNPNSANIIFNNLSLLPGRRNEITFLYYRDERTPPVAYKFEPPQCSIKNSKRIKSLEPFKARGLSAANIEEIATRNEINPSLLAALVAQESGFNPFAISWAKAVGLTQVTSLANQEILPLRPQWQYNERVEKLNYLQLKTEILTGKINKDMDWRLDRLKSLEGGSLYLNILRDYWEKGQALRALKVFKHPPMTDILLASYNSGAYRVKRSILRNKHNWLKSRELREARKYVMNIKSYCYAFSAKEKVVSK